MNNERKNILTDEQVEEISTFLGENVSEDVKNLREIKEDSKVFPFNAINKSSAVVSDETFVEIDPNTGERKIGAAAPMSADVTLTEVLDGTANKEYLKDGIKIEQHTKLKEFGLTDDDAMAMMNIIMRHTNGEKFSVYPELPEQIKIMVNTLAQTTDRKILNTVAKELINNFANELSMEKEFIDFQESLKKELNIPGLIDMYADHQKTLMEEELLKKAELLQESHPEKAEQLREISKAFKDSYTFDRLKDAVKNNELCSRKLSKEIARFNRHCTEFNFKYEKSKFKINDIALTSKCLDRHIPKKYNGDDILKFITLFCRYTKNMSSDNVVEHSYMYYTVKNVLALDFLLPENEFYKETIKNITEVMDIIREKEANK